MEDFFESLKQESANVVLETEVRTKIVLPIFEHLGYSTVNRAEEFPIFAFAGGKELHAKPADVIYFDRADHHEHRTRAERDWVKDHSQLVIEIKKPTESLSAEGQAQFYAQWARAPFYVITNGLEMVVYKVEGLFRDQEVLRLKIAALERSWAQLERVLSPGAIQQYCRGQKLKHVDPSWTSYANYSAKRSAELINSLDNSLERRLSHDPGVAALPAMVALKSGSRLTTRIEQHQLLHDPRCYIVLAEPGGGKTHLLRQLAVHQFAAANELVVPVIIEAKNWGVVFDSIVSAVYQEVIGFEPHVTEKIIQEDLNDGRFLLLIDGLDEVEQSEAKLRFELMQFARSGATKVIATCRTYVYHHELREQYSQAVLEPLSDSDIEDYVGRILNLRPGEFRRAVGGSLHEVARTPLFLVMICAVLGSDSRHALPTNRAELYERFSFFLLSDWESAKGRTTAIDVESKLQVLSTYAYTNFRRQPSNREFNQAVEEQKATWDTAVVRAEVLRSGLVRLNRGRPEFVHPSFEEYFYARHLADSGSSLRTTFLQERSADESFAEVFSFLAGSLQSPEAQRDLLDYLEENNIRLFQKCLSARYRNSEVRPQRDHESFARSYLSQLRATYQRITTIHWPVLKTHLSPWNSAKTARSENVEVTVSGRLDFEIP